MRRDVSRRSVLALGLVVAPSVLVAPAAGLPLQVGPLSLLLPDGVVEQIPPGGSSWDWWGGEQEEGRTELGVRAPILTPSVVELTYLALAPGVTGVLQNFAMDGPREVSVPGADRGQVTPFSYESGAGAARGALLAVADAHRGAACWLSGTHVSASQIQTLVDSARWQR